MDMPSPSPRSELTEPFRIGEWDVDASAHRLTRPDETVRLEPRTMEVLLYLAARAGQTVAREQIEEDVWTGRVVGYDSLNITISKLRKALDDDPRNPRFIETIPKVGYRFIGQVVPSAGAPDESPPTAPSDTIAASAESRRRPRPMVAAIAAGLAVALATTAWLTLRHGAQDAPGTHPPGRLAEAGKPSIAVLPFDNVSGDPEQEYFSDGITDDLITDLSKISGLTVIARNSVFAYKGVSADVRDVARQLGVRYVLEGSVRKARDTVRINAQLVDAASGTQLWADRYDGPLADVFTLQDDVTGRIVAALQVRLTPAERRQTEIRGTESVPAYDAFLRGWAHLLRKTPRDAVQAIQDFERAVQLDPDYDRAYAALAQAYWDNAADPEFNTLIGPPMSASTHVGYTGVIAAWKYLQLARGTPSSQSFALAARMLQRERRFDEAMAAARRAVALGPNDPVAYDVLIENLIYAGAAEEALALVDDAMRLDPHLPGEKLFLRGMAYYSLGRLEAARSAIVRARDHNPRQTRYGAVLAAVLAEIGRPDEAEAALDDYRSGLVTYTTLNWVMFQWPYRDLETASRLARALTATGLSVMPRSYFVVDADDRLTGGDIERLLSGKTIRAVDVSFYGGDDFRVSRDPDLQIVDQGYLTYFTRGESRIEGDLLCDPWYAFGDYCVAVYRNPSGSAATNDEYLFFTLMSVFAFSVVD